MRLWQRLAMAFLFIAMPFATSQMDLKNHPVRMLYVLLAISCFGLAIGVVLLIIWGYRKYADYPRNGASTSSR